jgi:hypothetical protein
MFVPISVVTGLSVFSRRVTHGTPRAAVSSDCNINQELFSYHTARQGGIHITHNNHQIRPFILAKFLKGRHNFGSLNCMGTGASIQKKIRLRKLKILEKGLGHLIIIMLACMHDLAAHLAMLLGFPVNRSNLHKVWPRSRYQKNSHNVTLAPKGTLLAILAGFVIP